MVFISYSRADLTFVQGMADTLRAQGCQTWIDVENLRPGERWKTAIEAALAAAEAFVLVVSRKSLDSLWTSHELRLAKKAGLRIVPVLIEPVPFSDLPPEITERQILPLYEIPYRAMAMTAAAGIADSLGLLPNETEMTGNQTAPLWIEIHPQGCTDTWHHDHEAGRPVETWRLRLDYPFDPLRFDVLLGTVAKAPSATLLIPPRIAPEDASFVVATLAMQIGPQRLCVMAEHQQSAALQTHAVLLQVHVLVPDAVDGYALETKRA